MSKQIDGPAAVVISKLVDQDISEITGDEKSHLTRFILSLRARHPGAVQISRDIALNGTVAKIRKNPDKYRNVNLFQTPGSVNHWDSQKYDILVKNLGLNIIPRVIANNDVGERVFSGDWRIFNRKNSNTDFILCDRPCILSGNAIDGEFSMCLPLSPDKALFVFSDVKFSSCLTENTAESIVRQINVISAKSASERIYSTGAQHIALAQKYLAKNTP